MTNHALSSIDSFCTHRALLVGPCGTAHSVLVRPVEVRGGAVRWWATSYGARFDATTGAGFEDGPVLDVNSIEVR